MLTAFPRVIRFALNNFWRDIWLSSVTILTFVLSITLVGVLSGVRVITDQAITILRSKVDVTISFQPGSTEKTVLDLKSKIEKLPETSRIEYVSAEENLQRFQELHKDDPTITKGTEAVAVNPFGPSLNIKARSLEDYPQIAKVFEDESIANLIERGGKSLESNQLAIQKLSHFTKNLNRFNAVLTMVFSLIAIVVVVNTMRIAIYTHREEIGIMKLVGASNWFVRGPFLIESIFIGMLASFIASLILLLGIALPSGWFDTLFKGFDVRMAAYLTSHFFQIFWLPLIGAILLSVLSAGIAVGRYLKV